VPLPRLRQAVLVARDLAAVTAAVEQELSVRAPFHDQGVGHFGLANSVYAIGDTFLEVVSPLREDTAAGRELARRGGDGGYMAMFQLDDVDAARHRLADLGVRVVWETAHDDIVDLHLHPKDVPGAIVALDVVDPPGSWRWGGPAWAASVPDHAAGGLRGLTVAVADPQSAAKRWAAVIGVGADGGDIVCDGGDIVLDGGRQRLRFIAAGDRARQGIVEVAVSTSTAAPRSVDIGGVRFDLTKEME
jgi:hypothetical protein